MVLVVQLLLLSRLVVHMLVGFVAVLLVIVVLKDINVLGFLSLVNRWDASQLLLVVLLATQMVAQLKDVLNTKKDGTTIITTISKPPMSAKQIMSGGGKFPLMKKLFPGMKLGGKMKKMGKKMGRKGGVSKKQKKAQAQAAQAHDPVGPPPEAPVSADPMPLSPVAGVAAGAPPALGAVGAATTPNGVMPANAPNGALLNPGAPLAPAKKSNKKKSKKQKKSLKLENHLHVRIRQKPVKKSGKSKSHKSKSGKSKSHKSKSHKSKSASAASA